MQRRVGVMVATFLVVLASVSSSFAQSLAGLVTDEQGGAVAGAEVRVSRDDGAAVRRTVTDAAGAFRFEALAPGQVIVEVEKRGFRRMVDAVALTADRPTTLALVLTVSGVDEKVLVTAAGLRQTTDETSKAITSIDADEMASRNTASLLDIVRLTPGVQVRDSGGPGQLASLRIRGLRPDATAVLVDGLRLRDASTTQGDISSLLASLHFVAADRVEVLRGSGSSLYGTNAVGGVVNIVTKPGGGPFRGELQTETGSLGQWRTRGTVQGGALNERLSYAAGLLQMNVTDGLDGDDAMRTTGVQGQLRYDVAPTTTITARVMASRDRVSANESPTAAGIPGANLPTSGIIEAIPLAPDELARANAGQPYAIGNATYIPGRNDPDSERRSWFHTTALQLQHVTSPRLSWQVSYQRVHSSRTYTNGPVGPGTFQPVVENLSQFVGDVDTLDARAILTPAPWLTVSAGYELEREGYADHIDDRMAVNRVDTRARIVQRAHALFGAAHFGLVDRRLQVSLSGRAQSFDLSAPVFSTSGMVSPYEAFETTSPPAAVTGDVSAAYFIPSSATKLRVHAGNAYRAPSLYERFGGGFYSDFFTQELVFSPYGDPRLEPDRYRSIDGGVDQYFWRDRVLASVTAFYVGVISTTAFDLGTEIQYGSDPFGRSFGYVNGSGGRARGVELNVEARPSSSVRLAASFTHTDASTDEDITVRGFFRIIAALERTAAFMITNRWTPRLETTFDVLYGSESFGSFTVGSFPNSEVRAFRYPSFTRASLVASYELSAREAVPVRAYLRLDNLFNETYFLQGWRQLGRTAVVGVAIGR